MSRFIAVIETIWEPISHVKTWKIILKFCFLLSQADFCVGIWPQGWFQTSSCCNSSSSIVVLGGGLLAVVYLFFLKLFSFTCDGKRSFLCWKQYFVLTQRCFGTSLCFVWDIKVLKNCLIFFHRKCYNLCTWTVAARELYTLQQSVVRCADL